MRALSLALFLATASHALAAPTTVTYKSGDETVSAYLALPPAAAGRHPAILLIHEWWGQNEWVREKARGFAEQGYVALAIDLYRGKSSADPDVAHQLMRGVPNDRARRDLAAAFAYLAARPDVDAARIGSVGWCMGGGYSLELAVDEPRLAAAVIYYGSLVTDDKSIAKIHAPLLGNFGADDQGIPPAAVKAFADRQKSADFKIYPGAGHGFASSSNPATFRTDAAKDANARTDAFFAKHLKKK